MKIEWRGWMIVPLFCVLASPLAAPRRAQASEAPKPANRIVPLPVILAGLDIIKDINSYLESKNAKVVVVNGNLDVIAKDCVPEVDPENSKQYIVNVKMKQSLWDYMHEDSGAKPEEKNVKGLGFEIPFNLSYYYKIPCAGAGSGPAVAKDTRQYISRAHLVANPSVGWNRSLKIEATPDVVIAESKDGAPGYPILTFSIDITKENGVLMPVHRKLVEIKVFGNGAKPKVTPPADSRVKVDLIPNE